MRSGKALPQCRGAYGIAVLCLDYPDTMIGARLGSPLVVGLGDEANFIASDASAFVGRAKEAVFLNDGELAVLQANDFRITTLEGQEATAVTHPVDEVSEEVELGDFDSYMEKEIYEQPMACRTPCSVVSAMMEQPPNWGGLRGMRMNCAIWTALSS